MINNNQPLISIIAPVYNAEEYLLDFFLSLDKQLFNKYELILVDDGSVDKSYKICGDYAKGNNQVKLFKKNNGGVSSSRNLGLKNAKGEFILFLDPDDFLCDNALPLLSKYLEKENPDILFFNYKIIKGRLSYIHKLNDIYKHENGLEKDRALSSVLKDDGYQGFVWNKVYKMKIIQNQQFKENVHYLEDTIFNVEAIKKSKKMITIRDVLVNYRQHNNSAISKFSEKQLTYLDALSIMKEILPISFSEDIEVKKSLAYILFGSKSFRSNKDVYLKMKKNFNENKILKAKYNKKIEKILLQAGYFSFDLAIFIFFIKEKIVYSKPYYLLKNR